MQLQRSLAGLPGILDAGVVMGTDANKDILSQSDLLSPEAQTATADDLVITVKGTDEQSAKAAIEQVDELLCRLRSGVDQEYRPKAWKQQSRCCQKPSGFDLVPGRYAAWIAANH
jgi:FdrA protein